MARLIPVTDDTSERRAGVVIFVHGLNGDPITTWGMGADSLDHENYWPRWIANDFKSCAVFSLEHPAALSAWTGKAKTILGGAQSILNRLRGDDLIWRHPAAPIVFVCHSLGGLLIKQAIKYAHETPRESSRLLDRVCGVAFLGTPHLGAGIASIAKNIIGLRANRVVEKLERSEALEDLNRWYQKLEHQHSIRFHHLVLRETESYKGIRIVSPDSADPGLPNATLEDVLCDHIQLTKPRDLSSSQHFLVKKLIADALQGRPLDPKKPPQRIIFNSDIDRLKFYRTRKEMEQIDKKFIEFGAARDEPRFVVLRGSPGAGKSVLARHYALQRRDRGQLSGAWLIHAASVASIDKGLVELGNAIGIKEENPGKALPRVLRTIAKASKARPWLLIYDNLESISHLKGRCPKGADLLVTTRSAWDEVDPINIGPLEEEQAVALLVAVTGDERDVESARELARALGCLPVALMHAAKSIARSKGKLHYKRYLERLDELVGKQIKSDGGIASGDSYNENIIAVFIKAFNNAVDGDREAGMEPAPGAQTIIERLAFMSPNKVPIELLSDERLPADARDDAIDALENASLVTRNFIEITDKKGEPDIVPTLDVHRLARLALQRRLPERIEKPNDMNIARSPTRTKAAESCLLQLRDAISNAMKVHDDQRVSYLEPHAVAALDYLEKENKLGQLARVSQLMLEQLGDWRGRTCSIDGAISLYQRAIAINAAYSSSEDNGAVVKSRDRQARLTSKIGEMLLKANRLDEALERFEEADAVWMKIVGTRLDESGRKAVILANRRMMADVHILATAFDKAQAMLSLIQADQDAMASRSDVTKWDRAELARTLSARAEIFLKSGAPDEARKLFERSCSIRRSLCEENPGHRDFKRPLAFTLTRLGEIALVSDAIERSSKLLGEALEIRQSLHRTAPLDLEFKRGLADALCANAIAGLWQREFKDARACLANAAELTESLMAVRPEAPEVQILFARSALFGAIAASAAPTGSKSSTLEVVRKFIIEERAPAKIAPLDRQREAAKALALKVRPMGDSLKQLEAALARVRAVSDSETELDSQVRGLLVIADAFVSAAPKSRRWF